MEAIRYKKLSVLVADDFSNFRSSVVGMLADLGVTDIETASTGEEVIERCSRRKFNVILCDYDLGAGRNGQLVLEELRYRNLLRLRDVFFLISAEASRNVFMSAYEHAPDDYLMKPITTKMLHSRLERVLRVRLALSPVYLSLEGEQVGAAIDKLIPLSLEESRHAVFAQKMLGELFISNGDLSKADKLYRKALEVRELDWARLGVAKVRHLSKDYDAAETLLQQIVDNNYLYLPAYDILADNYHQLGDKVRAQQVQQQSVNVSPISILRQRKLAGFALENGDLVTAIDAMKKTVKLGRLSCYGSGDDSIHLARYVSSAVENNIVLPQGSVEEALAILDNSRDRFVDNELQYRMSRCRLLAASGAGELAKQELNTLEQDGGVQEMDVDSIVDQIKALLQLGEHAKAQELLKHLQHHYADDQGVLEKIDEFLDEPVSEANKALVAQVNHEGIELYNRGQFEEALVCFERARVLFPKHVGLQLNILQALVGKLKTQQDEVTRTECFACVDLLSSKIDQDDSHFKRFAQLKLMVKKYALFDSIESQHDNAKFPESSSI